MLQLFKTFFFKHIIAAIGSKKNGLDHDALVLGFKFLSLISKNKNYYVIKVFY